MTRGRLSWPKFSLAGIAVAAVIGGMVKQFLFTVDPLPEHTYALIAALASAAAWYRDETKGKP